MKIELHNKVALITAASGGIGYGIASVLANAGARVAICAREPQRLNQAVTRLRGESDSDRFFAIAGDIGELDFLETLVQQTTEYFGDSIDILVNNSGGPPTGDTFEMTEKEWDNALGRNLLSVIRLCKLVAPGMKQKGCGRIVNLTSLAGKEPDPGMILSSVARAGVSAYSKTIAQELGPFGITVNTILTGGCLTDRLNDLLRQEIEGTDETLEAAVSRISAAVPMRFIATPEQFAQTILFIVSQEASYLSGTSIPLDGGVSRGTF